MLTLNGYPPGKGSVRAASGDSFLRAILRSVDCFRRERIPYVLIGAWALAVWGRPRATTDVDFLVKTNEENLERLAHRMILRGMEVDEVWREWNPMLRGSQIRLRFRGVAVDILRTIDAHDHQIFRRRLRKRMEGRYYWVIAPEDLILQKLKVGRPRDFEDALGVLEPPERHLDRAYLTRWARRLGVSQELDYVLAI